MHAIINIKGKQYNVMKNDYIIVDYLHNNENDLICIENVLLFNDNDKTIIGKPIIKNIKIQAKIVKHFKGKKIIVFKKIRRKSYQKINGHRSLFTKLLIENIINNN